MAELVDNAAAGRFEMEEGGAVSYADYRRDGGTLVIDYVFSPPELRGTGAAGRLMEGVLAVARTEGAKVVPICGYAAAYMRRRGSE